MPGSDFGIRNKWFVAGLTLLSVATYYYLVYQIPRYFTFQVQVAYVLLFVCYIILYRELRSYPKAGVFIAILFRLILFFSIPSLSDDFYRFIWDSRLLASGFNPFSEVPEFYMNQNIVIPGITRELFNNLNFTIYHTMYPPVAQFTGWVAVMIGDDSIRLTVMIMRFFILGSEIGTIWLIHKLLGSYSMPQSRVLLYALNPLVVLELTGNLHHEAFVIFFLLLTVYFLKNKRLVLSGVAISLAIASKLLPVIFLPLFLKRLGFKKALGFYLIVAISTIILFSPFLNYDLFQALLQSGWLYFQRFEFNASVYYVVREVGFWVKGYNIIQSAGIWLAAITFFSIILYAWLESRESRKSVNLPQAFMWVLALYLAFTTTLHPWYIVPLIAFSVFTSYRWTIAWTLMIFFSYTGYTKDGYKEPIYLILAEYIIVYGILFYEILRKNDLRIKSFFLNLFKSYFKT